LQMAGICQDKSGRLRTKGPWTTLSSKTTSSPTPWRR
jgi:hypothetical protein